MSFSERLPNLNLFTDRAAIRRAESEHNGDDSENEDARGCLRNCLRNCATLPCIVCGKCLIKGVGLEVDAGDHTTSNEEFVKVLMKDQIHTSKGGDFTFPTQLVPIPVDIPSRELMSVGRLKAELAGKILKNRVSSALHIYETVGKYKTYHELSDDSFLPPEGDIYLSVDITINFKLIQAFHYPLKDKSLQQRGLPKKVNLLDDSTHISNVQVAPNGTIRDIRQGIATVRETRVEHIHMFWKGQWLTQNGVGLKTFHLTDGCTVLVRDSPWLIQIQTLHRQVIFVCARPTDPAEMLRIALGPCINPNVPLHDYEFVASDGFTLFEEQLNLDEEQPTLDFLGVKDGGVLHLVPKTDFVPPGCHIPKAEHRGITLIQLRQVAAIILKRCVPEGWRSTNPALENKLLSPEDVTLYDLMTHFIKKVTDARKCSYVELVSRSRTEQIPSYFCSHWWGENVLDFVACLEQHAKDRGIPDTTPYWVCAYALNQHDVAGELSGSSPKASPFFRAMNLTKGTVSVLDTDAVCYTRIWCAYEIALVMHELKKKGTLAGASGEEYQYDVYTCVPEKQKTEAVPVGLLDQLSSQRKQQHGHQEREVSFPLDTLHKALTMQLERASASMQQDKIMILNSIIGKSDLSSLPPQYHSSYDNLNASLRARLAESTYPIALEKGHNKIADFRLALANAPYEELSVSFSGCKEFLPEARLFWRRSLPSGLSGLDLDVSNLPVKSSEEFIVGLGRLTKLKKLKLAAKDCRQLKNVDQVWKEIGMLTLLEELDINFSGCSVSGMDSGWDRPLNSIEGLVRLRLNFAGAGNSNACIGGFKRLRKMSELYLNVSDNALASIEGTEEALASYRGLTHLDLRCKGLLKIQTIRQLTDSMVTRKLVHLCLIFNGCSGLKDVEGLGQVIRHNNELVDVKLDFQYCRQITSIDEVMRGFSQSSFPSLTRLSMEFGYCAKLVLADLTLITDDNMPKLKSLKLGFAGSQGVKAGPRLLKGFYSYSARKFDEIYINLTGTSTTGGSSQTLAKAVSVEHVRAGTFQFLVPEGGGWMKGSEREGE